jgi:hypothetical protein
VTFKGSRIVRTGAGEVSAAAIDALLMGVDAAVLFPPAAIRRPLGERRVLPGGSSSC